MNGVSVYLEEEPPDDPARRSDQFYSWRGRIVAGVLGFALLYGAGISLLRLGENRGKTSCKKQFGLGGRTIDFDHIKVFPLSEAEATELADEGLVLPSNIAEVSPALDNIIRGPGAYFITVEALTKTADGTEPTNLYNLNLITQADNIATTLQRNATENDRVDVFDRLNLINAYSGVASTPQEVMDIVIEPAKLTCEI